MKKNLLIFALVMPILLLIGFIGLKAYKFYRGVEVEFPIRGYDPRDLLSGHYIIYQVDYGIENICQKDRSYKTLRTRYICLDSNVPSNSKPDQCQKFIKGKCEGQRFIAGIERFFIPEEKAKKLDQLVRTKPASIVVSLSPDGTALVKQLYIDGKAWDTY